MRARARSGRGSRAKAGAAAALAFAIVATATASARLPQGDEPVTLEPAEFTTKIDNPYFPLRVGSRWVYRETDATGARQKVVVTVTRRTKLIANGISARVVRDAVTEGGEPVEITDDFYAQDEDGNVWYLGEATTEYEDGEPVSTEGSFEAGVDGAQAGVIMPAKPRPGLRYRQEFYAAHAEDRAKVVSREERTTVPFGSFEDLLETKDVSPLDRPKVYEKKRYAKGIGLVEAFAVSGGSDHEVLIEFRR